MNAVTRTSGISSHCLLKMLISDCVSMLRSPQGFNVTFTMPAWLFQPGTLTTPRTIVPSSKYGLSAISTWSAARLSRLKLVPSGAWIEPLNWPRSSCGAYSCGIVFTRPNAPSPIATQTATDAQGARSDCLSSAW